MVDDVLSGDRLIGMIQPRNEEDVDAHSKLFDIGCAGRLTSFNEIGDGRYYITLSGIHRFWLSAEVKADTPYRQAAVSWDMFALDFHRDKSGDSIDREAFLDVMHDYLSAEGIKTGWELAPSAPIDTLVASLAMGCPFAPNEKQALLEAKTVAERAQCLMALMTMSGAGGLGGEQILQ